MAMNISKCSSIQNSYYRNIINTFCNTISVFEGGMTIFIRVYQHVGVLLAFGSNWIVINMVNYEQIACGVYLRL